MFNQLIRDLFVYIALPVAGLVCLAAIKAGKVSVLGVVILTVAVAAMFVFMPASTAQNIGTWAGNALSQLLP